MPFTLREIAERVGGRLAGDGSRVLSGVASLEAAGESDLTFIAVQRLISKFEESSAGAAILPEGTVAEGRDVIHHANPRAAMAVAIALFEPTPASEPGISRSSEVHARAVLGERVSVGPFAVIGEGATLGDDVIIGAGSVVAAGSSLGARTLLHPRVVVYRRVTIGTDCILHPGVVIGADGVGFTLVDGKHMKIPQVGGVEIGNDVEIGAGSCVDSGALAPTRVGDNTKIDNLVMVGHNTQLGRSVLLCGQSGIAGSSVLEDYVVLAGQAGVGGHLHMGQGSTAAAQSAVLRDVPKGEVTAGAPNVPMPLWKRMHAAGKHLPEMRDELKALRRRIAVLEAGGDPRVNERIDPRD